MSKNRKVSFECSSGHVMTLTVAGDAKLTSPPPSCLACGSEDLKLVKGHL